MSFKNFIPINQGKVVAAIPMSLTPTVLRGQILVFAVFGQAPMSVMNFWIFGNFL
jgi:hypothetical protein